MDRNEMIYELNKAEDIMMKVYWEIREERGYSAEAKRLDTILGKLYNLKCIIDEK